ncbi:MAG: 23S rRNA (uracil(1939)-C(5))-methyltransferase RlmD [Candidatus Caenarcaniphilales bacterium]|jgi:23S rRNA (uracil1939-C5)-methyltransferase|nr:23S rRNA (uracil(1939)-C(5))-methyltransferase RlmD [Candidatus Caenarcaniphilales bacterium]
MSNKVKIESMSHGAFAIARNEDGKVLMIENACPGDELLYEVYDSRHDFDYANIIEIQLESDLRDIDPPCKIHKICGSCQWQHINYEAQIQFKKTNLIDFLRKNHIEFDSQKIDFHPMDNPWNYRNKIIYPVETVSENNRLKAGYYKRNTNELINVKHCPIQYSIFDDLMEAIKNECTINVVTDSFLRHVLLRSNSDFSQILCSFIVRSKDLDRNRSRLNRIFTNLQSKFPQLKTCTVNINDDSTNVILGKTTEVFVGQGFILESFEGLELKISTESFFQVNINQFAKIISLMKNYINDNSKILDAYCGAGTIGLSLAKAKQNIELFGIEVVKSAVEDAISSALANGIKANFVCDSLENYSSHLDNEKKFDYVILNPPRKGATNKVLDALANTNANSIIYVSCNPSTLVRDIKYLEKYNYQLKFLNGIDMFPHSFHFESLAILEKTSNA